MDQQKKQCILFQLIIGGTNNYGFYGDIPAGTNRWNFFAAGTANNYLAGSLGIGSTSLNGFNFRISRVLTLGSSGSFGNGSQTLSATTNTNLYVVPSSTSAIVSTIVICNRATSARSFRVAIRPSGATLAVQHYIAYDVSIAANDSTALTLGVTLATTDTITVYASTTDLTFTAFGSEIV